MDYLFTTRKTEIEVGCGECALVGGVQTTKELLVDTGFKMPKVMRDMANSIFSKKIALVNDLTIVGFYIAADVMKMSTLDFPAGYVGRLDGIGPAYFPVVEDNINSLEHVLRLILNGRMIMENERAKIDRYQQTMPGRLDRQFDEIVPTFVPFVPVDKKERRKVSIN